MKKILSRSFKILWRTVLWTPVIFFASMGISALVGLVFERGEYSYDPIYEVNLLGPKNSHYTSGDSITDAIINYYAGVSDLDKEMRAEIYRISFFRSFPESEKAKFLIDSDIKETISFMENNHLLSDSLFKGFPDSLESDFYYYFIWNTYFLCGSPKIKFSAKAPFPFSTTKASAYYNPFSKVLFLGSVAPAYSDEIEEEEYFYWSPREFMEELAHAKQFKEKPFTSYAGATWGLTRSLFVSFWSRVNPFLEDKDWASSYQEEYKIKGSFEHEAHDEIFPCFYDIGSFMSEGEGLTK